MIITIPNILDSKQLAAVRSVLDQCQFIDGKLSAGENARRYKHNEELNASANEIEALNNVVMTQLVQHPTYLNAALPAKISLPIYARYSKGMSYGSHIDDPVMGSAAHRYRSDIAITLFLSNPEDYAGGELSIETPFGDQQIKLAAGDAVLYPASSRHSVKPVSEGERLVAIAWVQSIVRSAEQRQILFKLCEARDHLESDPQSAAYREVEDAYTGLVRLWAEV